MKIIRLIFVVILINSFLLLSCKQNHTPKPRGFFRIDFPAKSNLTFNNNFPYQFEYPKYSTINFDGSKFTEPYWMTIEMKDFNAKIHISYKRVENNLISLTEDSRELAYKHSIKATAINEQIFINDNNNVYGTIYEIKGNTASPFQFYLTDSTNHFLRGSLYISEVPNYDSLFPVIQFIEKDIYHLIETFSWN